MFRRRAQNLAREQAPEAPDAAPDAVEDPAEWDEEPADSLGAKELARLAELFALRPWDPVFDKTPAGATTLADAITEVDPLWAHPAPGEVQRGVTAIFGGSAPSSLVGVRLWPIALHSASGPALALADIRHRVHAVIDVAPAPTHRAPRPAWTPAAAIAFGARMAGSHDLWRHWAIELADHAPHEWAPACADHNHLARPNAQGLLVAGLPQHDAWQMSRSWLSSELSIPSVTDTRWLVLTASSRPLRERERLVRSQWDVVTFAEFADALTAPHVEDGTLPAALAAVVRMLLPNPATD